MQLPNPQTKKIVQLNNSDVMGDIWASFNLDLTENEGVFRVGKRLLLNTGTADVAEITSYPAAFKVFNGIKFAVAGASGTGYVFSQSSGAPNSSTFSKVTAANSPATCDSLYSDMEISNGKLYVSTASNSVYYTSDGSTWSASFTVGAGDSSSPHMMTSYAGRTYMTKLGSAIQSWDSANTVATLGNQYTLQLPSTDSNRITFLRSSANRIWIGVVNTTGGKGYVYEWDGASTQVQKSYRLDSAGALACVIKDDIPYIVDALGNLLVWNAGTFQKLTGLNRRRNRLLYNPLSSTNNRFIHPNGISVISGRICMLIDGRNYDDVSSIEETIPSGIYEYDPNHGLVHKYSIGLSKAAGTINDFGQIKVNGVGALSEDNYASTTSGRNGTFLAGATYYTNASSTSSGIFFDDSNDTERKAGHFITTKFRPEASKLGPTITSIWKKLYMNYRRLLSSNDRVVVKYRYIEAEPTEASITWVAGSTQFTTTTDVSAYSVGDEVEIIQGNGSGMCAHITAISVNAGTYTVTLDETFPTSTATAKARFQKWIKLGAGEVNDITSTWQEMSFPSELGMPKSTTWIQVKVWMLFTGRDEVETVTIIDTPGRIAQ